MITPQEEINLIFQRETRRIVLGLDRVQKVLSLFGNPERRFPVFHIAGTNGKGSVAAMLDAVLREAGYRPGLYTSPHLISFSERYRVGGVPISIDEAAEWIKEIRTVAERHRVDLTFFEHATVLAFLHFAQCRVDVGVIEVGMGGRLDATNVVLPEVSVVTTIAKDHEDWLGHGIKEIAREKAGIIKAGVPVVSGVLGAEGSEVVERVADEQSSPLFQMGRDFRVCSSEPDQFDYIGRQWSLQGLRVSLRGCHQQRNAAVALAALELAQGLFSVSESQARNALLHVKWPGRMDIVQDRPLVILDGAHNLEGVSAVKDEILTRYRGRRIKLLFAVMQDKDWKPMLNVLRGVSDEMVLTQVSNERSALADDLQASLPTEENCQVIPDAQTALLTLIRKSEESDLIVVTGSLFLVGEVLPLFAGRQ